MKASDLIKQLQELVDKHGDKDVKTFWNDMDYHTQEIIDVTDVTFEKYEDYYHIG